MLMDECQGIGQLVEAFAARRDRKTRAEQLEAARKDLQAAREALADGAGLVDVIRRRGLAPAVDVKQLRRVCERLAAVRAKCGGDAGVEAIRSGRDLGYLLRACEEAGGVLAEAAREAWKAYFKDRRPMVDRERLNWCRQSDRGLVQEIERLGDGAAELAMPKTVEEFDRNVQVLDRLRAALLRLPLDTDDLEVRAFLAAAHGRAGAELSQLTPAVLAWLKARNRDGRYTIRPRPE